jgi:hypothetical protein
MSQSNSTNKGNDPEYFASTVAAAVERVLDPKKETLTKSVSPSPLH